MSRPDPAREGIGRRLATLRLWGAATTVLPAVGLVPHGGLPLLLLALLVEGVQVALTWRIAKGVRDGTEGDLLYVAGGRIPRRLLQLQQLVEKLGLGLALVGMVALVALATPWTLIHAGLCVILWATVFMTLRVQWQATRLLVLLHDQKADEALALSERWRKGRFGALLANLHVTALLMNRRVEEARRLRADAWNGTIDRHALGIALDRLQSGDAQLARQVIAAVEGDDRYARYTRALLTGHIALLEADDAVRVEPDLLLLLPDVMANELRLVDAALARQRGDEALATERLGPVDLAVEGWRAAAYPRLWSALGLQPEAPIRPARDAPPQGDAFAPPSESAEGPRARWSAVGALPVTKAPITTPWRPMVQGALVLLSLGLLAIALLLLAIAVAARTVGELPLPGDLELSTFGVVVAVFILVRYAIMRSVTAAERGIVLEDGRVFDPNQPVRMQLAVALPFVTAIVVLPGVLTSLAWLADLLLPMVVFAAVWSALLFVQAVRRLRLVRIVRAVHVGSDDALARVTARVHHHGKAWAVLAHYVRGDLDAARAAGVHPLLVPDDVAALLRWGTAARGDVDVDALLDLPRPLGLGPRFLREVALRMAALHQGQPRRVADRVDPELYLPNRIGDALVVLDHQVLALADPTAARRFATKWAPELREGAWIRRCWPHLFEPSSPSAHHPP